MVISGLKFLSVDFLSVPDLQNKDGIFMNIKENSVIPDSEFEATEFRRRQFVGICNRVLLSKIKLKLLDDSLLNWFREV